MESKTLEYQRNEEIPIGIEQCNAILSCDTTSRLYGIAKELLQKQQL
jgi:hypothetical protein